ncbi:hypothetical protein HPB48_016120 [Haemaphysalis longicornis]|uniref:X-box-binding protein 1 n=1 Tax=Haemaphysalis longicornis TaxID=44386 RepID=A0A9J6GPT3_HAELO|nr:hypothetical protein HPB48_016120 [Haemaphysalis longicornis]
MGVPKRIVITAVRDRSEKSAAAIIAPRDWHIKSEMEVTVGEAVATAGPVRKRQRLDHLTREEKIMRRKLKNRVAAQSARDRKKARMDELEEQVTRLQADVSTFSSKLHCPLFSGPALLEENRLLRKRLEEFERENQTLVKRLDEKTSVATSPIAPVVKVEPPSPSPEGAGASSGSVDCPLDDAIRLLAADDDCDDLFALLQECSQSLLDGPPFAEDLPAAGNAAAAAAAPAPGPAAGGARQPLGRKRSTSTRLVGASPEELDSIKELIHFDHVYYKQEESAGAADVIMEDAPATVAAAAAASPQDTYILSPPSIASSPPPLIGPSSHPASRPVVFTPASPATSVVEVEDTVVVIEDSNDSAPLCLMSCPCHQQAVSSKAILCVRPCSR